MLIIASLTEPTWITSPAFPGVRIKIRRLNSMQMGAARARTYDVLRKLADGAQALTDYDLAGEDANGDRFNPADPEQALRLGMMIGAVETAIEGVIAWEGIAIDHAGTPAEINRKTLSALLLDDNFSMWLTGELERTSRILQLEGKGSPASRNGSSPPKVKASGRRGAKAAARPKSPAAAARKSTASTARKSNTPPKPPKA